MPLADALVSLKVKVPVVNLRQGPGTGYSVIGQVRANEELVPIGRTQDNSWFKARYQGRNVWVASTLVDLIGDGDSLPTIEMAIIYATAAPQPTATPTATATRPLRCHQLPVRGFGKVWANHTNIQYGIKCPLDKEQSIEAAVQQFQHGLMLWVAQDSPGGSEMIYVFYDDGTFQRFNQAREVDPAAIGSIPSGFYLAGDRFNTVYWEATGAAVKVRLGYATTPQTDSLAAVQQFQLGRMFWADTMDRIFVVNDDTLTWDSFEDTFN